MPEETDIVIVGAGAAGIGMGVLLKKMGLDFVILEKDCVGSSFLKWPSEMRFISPSFTGNSFGSPDLNSIVPDTSPAYFLDTEHPTGKEYAHYLEQLSESYKLPIIKGTSIKKVQRVDGKYVLSSNRGDLSVKHLIWAAGEFQYPNQNTFPGSELCRHTSTVSSWADIEGDEVCIIGGYESGMDAASQVASLGKTAHVIDSGDPLNDDRSDSSYSLSPYTKDRVDLYGEEISLTSNTRIEKVTHEDNTYVLHTDEGENIHSTTKPLLANGFKGSLSLIEDMFEWEDDYPKLNEDDESVISPNLFLSGPQVYHSGALFCFIYKFRQRFPIIAESLAKKLGLDQDEKVLKTVEDYKKKNYYLKDLTCCNDECSC